MNPALDWTGVQLGMPLMPLHPVSYTSCCLCGHKTPHIFACFELLEATPDEASSPEVLMPNLWAQTSKRANRRTQRRSLFGALCPPVRLVVRFVTALFILKLKKASSKKLGKNFSIVYRVQGTPHVGSVNISKSCLPNFSLETNSNCFFG